MSISVSSNLDPSRDDQQAVLAFGSLPTDIRDWLLGRWVRHADVGLATAAAPSRSTRSFSVTRCRAGSRYLLDYSTGDAKTPCHTWSAGDVVMCDNRCVLHSTDQREDGSSQVMHRGVMLGDEGAHP